MGISESEAGEKRYSKRALRADDSSDRLEFVSIVWRLHLTIQLTDGGPSVTPELPGGAAAPPFGGALGWAFLWP